MFAAVFSVNDDLWDFQAPTVINHCLPARGERSEANREREREAWGAGCRGRHRGKQGERELRESTREKRHKGKRTT